MQLLFAVFLLAGPVALGVGNREISWEDLLPSDVITFDDPFENLSQAQLADLGQVVRIRWLIENQKTNADGLDAQAEKAIVARLTKAGIDVDWLLSQRQRVAEMRRKRAEAGGDGVDGRQIRIPGYILPLKAGEAGVTEFLLVPWVGACIHTPPPPSNQIIYVSVSDAISPRGRFAPVWVEGWLERRPGDYDLFLVDGTRRISATYALVCDAVSDYSGQGSDVLARVKVPALGPAHSWFGTLQTRVSILFTRTMTAIRDRRSSGPVWIGLLVAFAYGVVHTLGPGHGKAVVVSYFVGHGGSVGRGLRMGTQIAICHVLSAIIIVWLTDLAVRQATGNAPSDYRLVKLVSYAAIAVIGGFMLHGAIRQSLRRHTHDHDRNPGTEGEHGAHHAGCLACREAANHRGPAGWLALAVGSVPCTGAILVLLFGMAHNLLWPAILMVVAISAGMAVAMSGLGVLAILGRNYADRRFVRNESARNRFGHALRIAGAAVVVSIGLGLFSLTLANDVRTGSSEATTASSEGIITRPMLANNDTVQGTMASSERVE